MIDKAEPHSLILIIDDSPDAIRLLAGMLKDQGQILFATSGENGIELAHQRRPDLILLDVDMPGMDGYEVCRRLKADPATQQSAVIFVTAAGSTDSQVMGLAVGAVDFITKPLNPPVVRARVQTHLKLQHQSTTLARLAQRDGLTGLYNRRYFDEHLEQELQRHKRQRIPLGLAMIDIDHFKAYNDSYGHLEGDKCLKHVAESIAAATRRPAEAAARYGGEEFAVILPHTSMDEARKFGDWLVNHVRSHALAHCNSPSGFVTISVGVTSIIPDLKETAQSVIAAADRALYAAKAAGRNCARSSEDA